MPAAVKRRVAALVLVALGTMLVAGMSLLLWVQPAGRVDFLLHHDRYETIVQTMKARPPGDAEHVDVLSVGEVSAAARRDGAGQYTIAITAFDRGHLGSMGYLFSDTPPTRVAGDPYSDVQAPGRLWTLGKQVAPHWWVISCHLD